MSDNEATAPDDTAPDTPAGSEPPLLDSIRTRGPSARGLNKPAILCAAGGGVAIVLVLASGAFTSDPMRKPTNTKPGMSDPARPEMAQGAIRALPADYAEVGAREAELRPADPPQLGAPLAGDVAAFAPQEPTLRGYSSSSEEDRSADAAMPDSHAVDNALTEAETAQRAGLFFTLRDPPPRGPTATLQLTGVAQDSKPRPDVRDPARETGRVLFPGAVISASLVTALNSEAPGPVIAQVTQAVYDSAGGHTLVIPQGARLIGDYKSAARYGQGRIAISWSRLIMPDGEERVLNEAASDATGAAGLAGEVDNHWGDVFGAAVLGTLVSVGVAATEDPQLTYGATGMTTRDPVDSAVAEGVQGAASSVTTRVVDRGLTITPTFRVQAGTRVYATVTRRLAF